MLGFNRFQSALVALGLLLDEPLAVGEVLAELGANLLLHLGIQAQRPVELFS